MKYGYTRTSTKDKQDDDLQRRALVNEGVAERDIFSDQVSGSRVARSRSGWTHLEERLCEGDGLVVWRIDRIGRSMIDVITTVKDLLNRGIEVIPSRTALTRRTVWVVRC